MHGWRNKIGLTSIMCLLSMPLFGQEIHDITRQGNLEKVKSRIEENSNLVNLRNPEGDTPLHFCASFGHAEIADYLIKKGADINIRNNNGWTPLHNASSRGHLNIVELFIQHGADIKIKDIYGATPLNRAVQRGHLEVTEYLLLHGADPNVKNPLGMTSIFWAVKSGNQKMLELLVAYGADLNSTMNDGETVLHLAASNGQDRIGQYLIARGMAVNAERRYGVTPLHLAAVFGRKAIARLLIENGADIHAKSRFAGLPIHQAIAGGQDEMVALLSEKGAENRQRDFPELRGDYLGMKQPGRTPEIFAPGVLIHVHWPHSRPMFSKDGTEVYWSAASFYGDYERIWFMKQENGRWQPPQVAPFSMSGSHIDGGPFFSPDGQRLYFHSTRSLDKNGKPKEPDFWYVERQGNAWGEPQNLGTPVNTTGVEVFGSISSDGTLYFQGLNREGGYGSHDIYKARSANGQFTTPVNLGGIINTAYSESAPFIAPDKSYLLFGSNRPGGYSDEFEIYVSFQDKDNTWTEPKILGETINVGRTTAPCVTPDGKYLFFNNARHGSRDFYWVDAKIIEELKPPQHE